MERKHPRQRRLSFLVALLLAALLAPPAWAAPLVSADPKQLFEDAQELERKGQWASAAEIYAFLLGKDRGTLGLTAIKEHYHLCLRHIHQARRLRDVPFQQLILNEKFDPSGVYKHVLELAEASYVDKERARPSELFRYGVLEFRFALEDPVFLQKHLPKVSAERVRDFILKLEQMGQAPVDSLEAARKQADRIALSAREDLELPTAVVLVEFACGACNGLDEYCVALTPSQLREVQALMKGELVGVGIELEQANQKLLVTKVHPEGPAHNRVNPGDRLTHINGKPADGLPAEAAAALLRGEAGTGVEIEVVPAGETAGRKVRLERRPFTVRTVESYRMLDVDVGYVKLVGFQKNTVQELKEAVLDLEARGMRVLVLDLRDNAGGAFKVGVEVARLFLTDGLVVHTQSRVLPEYNQPYHAKNPDAFSMPVVLLVNGRTASAAEVVVGALKENKQRAVVVGQRTFGKGTIQFLVPVPKLSTSVYITLARFSSPGNQEYTGQGVEPDRPVELDGSGEDLQQKDALEVARNLAMMLRPPSPPPDVQ